MIGSLRGEVLERDAESTLLIEVSGIGYHVTVTPALLAELEPGSAAFLHIHHHIRDDAQMLYGFTSRQERITFQLLLATHGVGPAMAMAILATHPPAALADVVAGGDIGSLTLVPGVGRKTAERLLVELKNRLSTPVLDPIPAGVGAAGSVVGAVREALSGLGYGHDEIRDTLREVDGSADAATMLREALKVLGARRA